MDTNELRRVAEAAGPGDGWYTYDAVHEDFASGNEADHAFIAAWNPATAIALLDERDKLRAVLRRIGQPGKAICYCRDGHEEAVLLARASLEEQK